MAHRIQVEQKYHERWLSVFTGGIYNIFGDIRLRFELEDIGFHLQYLSEEMLYWDNGNITDVCLMYNHSTLEVIEQLDGLCASAILVRGNHDLYTAASLEFLNNTADENGCI